MSNGSSGSGAVLAVDVVACCHSFEGKLALTRYSENGGYILYLAKNAKNSKKG